MPTSQKPTRTPGKDSEESRRVTSKDVPGTGMARRAAEAIETRRAERKELMRSIGMGD